MDELRLMAFVVSSAVVAVTARAMTEEEEERQWCDDKWQWSENKVFLYTTYHFRSEPEEPAKAHRVVWYPRSSKHNRYLYYFDHYTGLMWCRATLPEGDTPVIWQVLSEDERRDKIADIPVGVWDNHGGTQPAIPGSEDGALMEPPPIPPDPFAPPYA
jgi:hypothetical protein